MPQLAERLFHGRKHAAETAKDFGAGWAVAPAGRCDICSRDLDGKHGHRIPAAEFKRLVQQGYNPRARGRLARSLVAAADGAGISADQFYQAWRQGAMADTTDWALCDACLKDVAAFMSAV